MCWAVLLIRPWHTYSDIVQSILQHVPLSNLPKCRLVCKKWNTIAYKELQAKNELCHYLDISDNGQLTVTQKYLGKDQILNPTPFGFYRNVKTLICKWSRIINPNIFVYFPHLKRIIVNAKSLHRRWTKDEKRYLKKYTNAEIIFK